MSSHSHSSGETHARDAHARVNPPDMYASPRKVPQQERARQTVEVLLKATAELLEQEGYAQLSTNKIARRAGVSIGSLYQYFPSKEALIAALIEQVLEDEWASIETEMRVHALDDVYTLTSILVRRMLIQVQKRTRLHQVLMEQVPREGRLARILEFNERIAQGLVQLATLRRAEIVPQNLELAAYVVIQAVTFVAKNTVLHYPERLSDPDFAEELVALAMQYLTAPRAGLSGPSGSSHMHRDCRLEGKGEK